MFTTVNKAMLFVYFRKFRFPLIILTLFIAGQVSNISAHPAWGIVVDSQKQIYFSDLETVYKIDRQGKLSIFREGVSGRHVHDLSIDLQDNIYGLDNTYNSQTETFPRSIWKISAKGEFSYLVPMTNNLPLGMSIWRDFDGNTYSVEPYNNEKKETKIIKRTPNGKTNLFAGGKYGYLDGRKDKAEFSVITDIAFGRDNTIYLTNEDKVRKIDKFGIVTTIYNPSMLSKNDVNFTTSSKLFGLDVDNQNNVFTADFENRKLIKIDNKSNSSTFFTSEKDWSPIGVSVSNDEVYVLEARPYTSATHTGNRVIKISGEGKSIVLATLGETKFSFTNNANENRTDSLNNVNSKEPEIRTFLPYVLLTLLLVGSGVLVYFRKGYAV